MTIEEKRSALVEESQARDPGCPWVGVAPMSRMFPALARANAGRLMEVQLAPDWTKAMFFGGFHKAQSSHLTREGVFALGQDLIRLAELMVERVDEAIVRRLLMVDVAVGFSGDDVASVRCHNMEITKDNITDYVEERELRRLAALLRNGD